MQLMKTEPLSSHITSGDAAAESFVPVHDGIANSVISEMADAGGDNVSLDGTQTVSQRA